MSQIKKLHQLAKISNVDPSPVELFKKIIDKIPKPVIMNLATVDKEYGVLNRSVIYRGLSEGHPPHICFVTEKHSRKYENLKENPKVSLTIIYSIPDEIWQIRLFDADAVELNADTLDKLWQEESLHAKIRSYICQSRKRNDVEELEQKYQKIQERYEREGEKLERSATYTAFKIIPKIWEFYKREPDTIADRVQYKKIEGENDKWTFYHIDA